MTNPFDDVPLAPEIPKEVWITHLPEQREMNVAVQDPYTTWSLTTFAYGEDWPDRCCQGGHTLLSCAHAALRHAEAEAKAWGVPLANVHLTHSH